MLDKNRLINNDFDRTYIAKFGKNNLSKQSQILNIINQFRQYL